MQATFIQVGHASLMKTRQGKGRKFIAADHSLVIEESIFFESSDQYRRTQQMVLGGFVSGEETVM